MQSNNHIDEVKHILVKIPASFSKLQLNSVSYFYFINMFHSMNEMLPLP